MHEPVIAEIWERALEDAVSCGLPRNKAFLFPFEGIAPAGEDLASLFYPDQDLFTQPTFPAKDRSVLTRANSPQARSGYRIAVFCAYDSNILLGRIRHELEHARQWLRHGRPLFELEKFLIAVLRKVIAIEGGASYYNFIPTEIDANAAASRLLRAELDEDTVAAMLSDMGSINLVRFVEGPQDVEGLPERMLHFALLFREAAEAYAGSEYGVDLGSLVLEKWPCLESHWKSVRQSPVGPDRGI